MENKYAFFPADILLPRTGFEKWAVVACDQYTSEPQYWADVEKIAGDGQSALRLVLPEAYLGDNDEARISAVNKAMSEYLENGVFEEYPDTFVYVERMCSNGKVRHGIVGMVDLEDYDYRKGSNALIRATEETVLERIPPRVRIRRDAPLELPHVMLLINDPGKTVIEPLADKKAEFKSIYDFSLMKNSGHISGYAVSGKAAESIQKSISALVSPEGNSFLFAVGDGNHSLATAKECYLQNPCSASRYALVEVVNIHDTALEFEPIYRVLFGVSPDDVIKDFVNSLGGEYNGSDAQHFACVYGDTETQISVKPMSKLSVGTLQTYLDGYLLSNPSVRIDYIHGTDVVRSLCKGEGTLGFIFNGMRKDELFDAVRLDGSLPRKTFSMGQASDKRFYIEARKIK